MTRSDALFLAAGKWEERAASLPALFLIPGVTPSWPEWVPNVPGCKADRVRLWALRHAKRCRVLGLRAMREAARIERLRRYVECMRQLQGSCMNCDYSDDGRVVQRCEPCEALVVSRGGCPSA